jgi:hypothetical protein
MTAEEVFPDSFESMAATPLDVTTAADDLTKLMAELGTRPRPQSSSATSAARPPLAHVRDLSVAPGPDLNESFHEQARPRPARPSTRRQTAGASSTPPRQSPTAGEKSENTPEASIEPGGRLGPRTAQIPASVHDALRAACLITQLSHTETVLTAINRHEAALAAMFPASAPLAAGPIPVRARPRRRRNQSEPTIPVTLYLDAAEAEALAAMVDRVNAGSRSNLITEALRIDFGLAE